MFKVLHNSLLPNSFLNPLLSFDVVWIGVERRDFLLSFGLSGTRLAEELCETRWVRSCCIGKFWLYLTWEIAVSEKSYSS